MSTGQLPQDALSPAKRALYEIRSLKERLQRLESSRTEPIAVVGLGLRFPGGAVDPDSFWDLLERRVDAVSEVPPDRWPIQRYYDPDPTAPGKMYTRHAAFLQDVAGFDAAFFGISPREAASLDPQHRIALEVTWEALENAGQSPAKLGGSATGVFLALSNSDYARRVFARTAEIDIYSSTGNNFSTAAGRISYTLGLEGPSMVVDTACSGSLVAVHLACNSLRAGECSLALAGGVNLILSPEVNINFSKARMMAADGKCKTFDAAADGYVRGEGCGMVVLKRLSDALRDRDRILALVRGSAVNQDGRSGGLTVPNGSAQRAVIRQALTNAGLEPRQIGYLEAHGTGTSLGDPIEAHALAAALGEGRTADERLVLGSVKTNLGHLEAAAGVAGLIKVILSLQHGVIPAHLHFHALNPQIHWGDVPVLIPADPVAWPHGPRRRFAGVSSFGFSGTNAHVIVEEAPAAIYAAPEADRPLHVLALSARSAGALQQLTRLYTTRLERGSEPLPDLCATANGGRAHFNHRAVYAAASREEMLSALAGGPLATGDSEASPEIVFVFSGEEAFSADMGRGLYQSQPVFRSALEQCAELIRPHLESGLIAVMYGDERHLLHQPAYAQPALFALEYAMAQLWMSWGIRPAAVLGEGSGEYAAATIAGVWSLADGLQMIAARGRLMQTVESNGAMAAAASTFGRVAADIRYNQPQVAIMTGEAVKPEYWSQPPRARGGFRAALKTLAEKKNQVLLEIGPSARQKRLDWAEMTESLAQLYVAGADIDWTGFDKPYERQKVALPTYPFERHRHWIEAEPETAAYETDAWDSVREAAARQSRQCGIDLRIDAYAEQWRVFDALTLAYTVEAFRGLGVFARCGERHTPQSLIRQASISDGYLKLIGRWLARTAAAGLLRQEGDEFVALRPLAAADTAALVMDGQRIAGADRSFLDYVIWCGERLLPILTGRLSPLETLFPGGDFSRAEDLYERAPLSQYFSAIARAAVEGMVRLRPARRLEVLEIGAGTGATSAAVLPALNRTGAAYTFTDVSQLFLDRAARKFAAYPFVRYGIFDVERSGDEQGYLPGSFDIVVATNVLHATRDIAATLRHVRSLLAPGGILVLCEATTYLSWYDITTGLIEGWQTFADSRKHHPLLSAGEWLEALAAAGFERSQANPEAGSPALVLGQHVIIAQVPRQGMLPVPVDHPHRVAMPIQRSVAAEENPADDHLARLLQAPAAAQQDKLLELVRRNVAELLGMSSTADVSRRRRLIDLGLDSLMAIELRDRIARALHLDKPLPATLVFDHPTTEAIAGYLAQEVLQLTADGAEANEAKDAMARRAGEIEDLEDAEVEALLRARLASL